MRNIISKITIALVLASVSIICNAEEPSDIDKAVDKMISKYENTEGVECLRVVKGEGLNLIKMMFNKEFGRQFMKGVTSIMIMEYGNASETVCQSIHNDIEQFSDVLEEFDPGEEVQFGENEYFRCFASKVDSDSMSDFLIIVEGDGEKMLMYMGGKIIVE